MDTSSTQGTDELAKPKPENVAAYHRAKRAIHIVDIFIAVLYWTAWVFSAPRLVAMIANHVAWPPAAMALSAVIMIGGMIILSLPLEYYSGFLLERRYQLTNQTPATWAWFQVKTWLLGSIIGGIVLGGLYALLWYGGEYWSVWLWCGVMLLSVGLAKLFPLVILPLFYPARPLERPSLAERLSNMAQNTGLKLTGIYDLQLSKDTKKANAMLAGLGSSRRVYFSDTLLEAFDDNQIAVVFAHELGHHIRGHIWKGIGLTAVVSSVLVALIHWRLNPYAGNLHEWRGAIAALPQLVLISVLFPLLIAPITNAISRRFERQCDSDALRLTDDPGAYRTAFQKLSDMNMADPNPPRWEEILFDDHPAMSKRIAMADRYVRSSN